MNRTATRAIVAGLSALAISVAAGQADAAPAGAALQPANTSAVDIATNSAPVGTTAQSGSSAADASSGLPSGSSGINCGTWPGAGFQSPPIPWPVCLAYYLVSPLFLPFIVGNAISGIGRPSV